MQGKARISLYRKGVEVKRVEKKNNLTGYLDGLFNEGNFHYMTDRDKLMSINDNFFKGCLMTDKVNDARIPMIAGDTNITAQASNDAYSGVNLKRGSYSSTESGVITGGYRNVFNFSTSQGNGTIASVCLCRPSVGAVYLGEDFIPEESQVNEILHETNYNSLLSEELQDCSIIDYDKQVGYKIVYADSVITVTEYPLNTKDFYITGGIFDVAGDGTVHTINQTVKYFTNTGTASVSYTGSAIHLITFVPNSGTLADYAIDTTNWTCTETEHSYNTVSLMQISIYNAQNNPILRKDVMPIIGNYIYALKSDGTKIYKLSMTTDADFDEIAVPSTALTNTYNGGSVILPNGDWYKFPVHAEGSDGMTNCLYYHNDKYYRGRYQAKWVNATYGNANSFNYSGYGTILCIGTAANRLPFIRLDTLFPMVTTVANLDEAVIKSADLTMKLTYEITQGS